MLYKRGGRWWYKFKFAGRVFREPTKTNSKEIAARAERNRRRELEEGYHGLAKKRVPLTLKQASDEWLEFKRPTLADKSYVIEKTNLGHLLPVLGHKLLNDIKPEDIGRYQQHRHREKASPKTINLEIGTLRAILRRHRLWASIQPDVRMLQTRDDVGKALTMEEEKDLLDACSESRSRSLMPAVLLALNTGMRLSEMRLLRWGQIDLKKRTVRVGKSKTQAGAGRTIPLNEKATSVLQFWADQFPKRRQDQYVFPSERYGAGGDKFDPCVYDHDATHPIKSWKEAWESAKDNAGVEVRFHDLRHTVVTRMLEGGAPLSVVAAILGWSPATTVRMAKRYGHIGQVAQRQAVELLDIKTVKPPEDQGKHEGSESNSTH